MADIKLNVTALAQEATMCCWHTSAMMIWHYWQQLPGGRAGPMNTIAPTYTANTGISPQAFITLAKTVGLLAVERKNIYASEDLYKLLAANGPLWAAGYWYGSPHIIVVTGVDNARVYLNDPDGAKKKSEPMTWFNEKLASSLEGCLMAKNPKAY